MLKKTKKTQARKANAAKTASPKTKKTEAAAEAEVAVNRRASDDRRAGDRRKQGVPVAEERRGLERREKVSRRRQIDPTTCERDYTDDEVEFMAALDHYKRRSGRMFPTCSEILEVVRSLGYEKRQPGENGETSPVLSLPSAAPMPAVQPTLD